MKETKVVVEVPRKNVSQEQELDFRTQLNSLLSQLPVENNDIIIQAPNETNIKPSFLQKVNRVCRKKIASILHINVVVIVLKVVIKETKTKTKVEPKISQRSKTATQVMSRRISRPRPICELYQEFSPGTTYANLSRDRVSYERITYY